MTLISMCALFHMARIRCSALPPLWLRRLLLAQSRSFRLKLGPADFVEVPFVYTITIGARDADFLREGVRVLSQALMELEVAQHVGADRYERTGERTG